MGAEWYFDVWSVLDSPTTYYHMQVLGDTIILNHHCSIITRQYLNGNGDEQFVYDDEGVVYWYNQTMQAFTILYDFNAEAGESWICDIDSCSFEVQVQSIEEVSWEGHTYRVQNVVPVVGDDYNGEPFFWGGGRIIEGIGAVGLFPSSYTCFGGINCGPAPDYLRCYFVDGEMLYHEGDLECDAVLPWQYPCWDGTVAEAYDGGNGTAEDPYQIATPQQLALLAQQTNDGTGGDAYYLLTDDICLNASLEMWTFNWKPIGRVTDSTIAYFRGHFDGNEKTVSKLYYLSTELMMDPVVGLFGCTDGAEIVNVNLSDCRLTGGEYAGGLVGYAGSTDISNCSVQNSQITTTGGVAGGIVGYAGMPFGIHETNENVSKITNCKIELVTVESSVDAGGIVGKINDDAYYARCLVSNCVTYNEQYYHIKGSVAGGIVGEMRFGTIEGCASRSIVDGEGQVSNVCAGGIAGSIHGSSVIANSYNRYNVVANYGFAGGIVGYSAGDIFNVYNVGEIYLPDPNSSGYGNIVGNVQSGERLNCYWLENDLPSAGNPILPDMPGSTSFHQGSTATSWVLDEPQYGTVDLVEALNAGVSVIESLYPEIGPVTRWKYSDVPIDNGLPVFEEVFDGPEWYYEIQNEDGSVTYQHLECAADTTINNKDVLIIIRTNTLYDKGEHAEVTREYIYEKDDIVYWWNSELQEFTALYDYGAQTGDNWVIKVGTETLTIHVNAVESIEYEGRTFRMLQVSDDQELFSGNIVCGIGHLTSFFPERLMVNSDRMRVEGLRCYWVGEELIFKLGDEDCDAIYSEIHGVDESKPMETQFNVYPNPADGVLYVETRRVTSLPTDTYRITNLMGETVQTGNLTAETQQIDVTNLPQGMYFISVGDVTQKFVVR